MLYKQKVFTAFKSFKAVESLKELYASSIEIEAKAGWLIPICQLHVDDQTLISKLGTWRSENAFAYPSQFPVTFEGTSKWLRNHLLEVKDRILFLVLDPHGYAVGHLGFANSGNDRQEMEIDNVVRGVKSAQPGIMTKAMLAMLSWARVNIDPKLFYLRVLSDNHHAIDFYRKIHFEDDNLIPLKKVGDGEVFNLVPLDRADEQVDRYFLRMIASPFEF